MNAETGSEFEIQKLNSDSLAISPNPSLSKLSPRSESDEVEQKIWDIGKQIPGLNVGYGSVRLVIYIGKGNREESWKSVAGVAKGLVQSAAIAGSVFVAPIVTPIVAGALTGVVSESINGVAHLIVFIIEHPDEFRGKDDADRKEKLIYKEVKEIPAIGTAYSAARTPIYLIKGNKNEAKISGISSILGTATTATTCGVGMLTMVDDQTQKLIQKVSKSVIQLVSRKVLEKVAAQEMTLEEGLGVVESVEAKWETFANGTEKFGTEKQADEDSLSSELESKATDVESIKEAKQKQRWIRNKLERLLMLCKESKAQPAKDSDSSDSANCKEDMVSDIGPPTIESDVQEPIIIVI